MSAKPAHAHCHRCGAIARMDVSNPGPPLLQQTELLHSSSDFQLLARTFASVDGALCCPRSAVRDHATVLNVMAMGDTAASGVLGSVDCIAKPAGTTVSGVRPRHMWIHRLWVREDRQSQGIASQLLAAAEGVATERGLPLVRLAVDPENEAARELYEHLGYKLDWSACLRAQTWNVYRQLRFTSNRSISNQASLSGLS